MNKEGAPAQQPTEDFRKIVDDFVADILGTFPEYADTIATWWEQDEAARYLAIFHHCQKVYPPHIFNILYKNNQIFVAASEQRVRLEFLPGIDFCEIWSIHDITVQTRDTIWQYLNLVMFSIIGTITDSSAFGEETSNLFGAISPNEMQSKMTEAINEMNQFFTSGAAGAADAPTGATPTEGATPAYVPPNPEQMQDHLNQLLGGKIGQFATELANEWADDLGVDFNSPGADSEEEMKKMFSNLVGNPAKMWGLVSKVGERFKEKVESGELDQKEIVKEAKELLEKLKDIKMPGLEKIQGMLSLLIGGGRGGMAAMAAAANLSGFKRQMEYEEMKEKLRVSRERLDKKRAAKAAVAATHTHIITEAPKYTDAELAKLFNQTGGTQSNKKPSKSNKK